MKTRTTTYEAVTPGSGFSAMSFKTKKEAFAEIKRNLDGCPDFPKMTPENRAYWKEHGKKMKVFKVVKTKTEVKP